MKQEPRTHTLKTIVETTPLDFAKENIDSPVVYLFEVVAFLATVIQHQQSECEKLAQIVANQEKFIRSEIPTTKLVREMIDATQKA